MRKQKKTCLVIGQLILGLLIAPLLTAQMIDLEIEAPMPDTITATMPGCRGMIDLPPADIITQDCADTLAWKILYPGIPGPDPDTLFTNGGKAIFRLGDNEVIYMATDTCGNTDMDTTTITVVDSIPPVARCTGLRSVSLDGSGMAFVPAFLFDNQSEEACFKYFKVRRLVVDTNCVDPNNPNNQFNDEVKFCCTDAGQTIDVVFKVYDRDPGPGVVPNDTLNDRADTCIAQVIVLDKAPPSLTCPPDITIECGDHIDFDTLGLPDISDNCNPDSVTLEFFIEKDIDQCGVGEFRRVIVGTDIGGLTDTCIQTITVVNNIPFDGLDTNQLMWPEPFVTVYDCIKVPDTSVTGRPIILEDQCAMASASFKDDVFQFSRGACSKVIRTWKVLDWCQYDPKVRSACTPDNGCWTFQQIIKVIDTIPPVITRPEDSTYAYLGPGCDSMMIDLDSATTDTCFFGEEVSLEVEIDFHQDGTIDRSIPNGDASGMYPLGMHWVFYIAHDECGNTTVDTLSLTVKDRVLPTPIAKNGLSTSVIDMGGGNIMVTIRAEQLNASSYDNCTAAEDLKFSFSTDTNETTKVFTCDTLGSIRVEFWVTDECGNQDFAEVFVLVEDNNGVCPNTANTQVSGLVRRSDGMSLKGVEVMAMNPQHQKMSMTSQSGAYLIDKMKKHENYTIVPGKNDQAEDGLNIKDIVLLQRHLLGMTEFDEVGSYISADVDRSGHLSTRDATAMRKILLGQESEYRHGLEWTFLPSQYQFKDESNPLDEVWPEKFTINNLIDPLSLDWKAYKLGDIDMSYQLKNNGSRSINQIEYEIRYNEEGIIEVVLNEEIWISAAQMTFILEGIQPGALEVSSILENWSEANFNWINDSELRVVWDQVDAPAWLDKGNPLLRITPNGDKGHIRLRMDSKSENILLTEQDQYGLKPMSSLEQSKGIEVRATPNPFSTELFLDIFTEESCRAEISVRSLLGTVIYQENLFLETGWNERTISERVFPKDGLYLVSIRTGKNNVEMKVVRGL